RGTGRPTGDGQLFDGHDEGFALDIVEADVEVVRYTLCHVAVDIDLVQLQKPVVEAIAQAADAFIFGGHFEARKAKGLAHADDLVGGGRARTESAFVPAAVHLGFDPYARLAPDVQRANTLGPVHLVRREGHEIDLEGLQIDVDLARPLRGVDMENNAL